MEVKIVRCCLNITINNKEDQVTYEAIPPVTAAVLLNLSGQMVYVHCRNENLNWVRPFKGSRAKFIIIDDKFINLKNRKQ